MYVRKAHPQTHICAAARRHAHTAAARKPLSVHSRSICSCKITTNKITPPDLTLFNLGINKE